METQFRLTAQGRRRQFLRVEVSDSGKGMTAEETRQLFTPFFTTKPSGTGLGLVLSQRIIALHGGKLWAEAKDVGGVPDPGFANRQITPAPPDASEVEARGREVGRGMTFCVMLPVGLD
jgi:signal transduction histidine kinase